MIGLDTLKDVRVPLLAAVGLVVGALTFYGWTMSTFVQAAQYVADQRGLQIQLLMRDRDQLAREEFRLAFLCEQQRRCSPTDRAFLQRLRDDLRRLDERISQLQRR